MLEFIIASYPRAKTAPPVIDTRPKAANKTADRRILASGVEIDSVFLVNSFSGSTGFNSPTLQGLNIQSANGKVNDD